MLLKKMKKTNERELDIYIISNRITGPDDSAHLFAVLY